LIKNLKIRARPSLTVSKPCDSLSTVFEGQCITLFKNGKLEVAPKKCKD